MKPIVAMIAIPMLAMGLPNPFPEPYDGLAIILTIVATLAAAMFLADQEDQAERDRADAARYRHQNEQADRENGLI